MLQKQDEFKSYDKKKKRQILNIFNKSYQKQYSTAHSASLLW